ncbi:MAG: FAD-dependent oxidoreductase [Pseudomonadota bacterium]
MKTDANHTLLFEPLAIGPKKTKNRFYQVPHCNGMGHRWPRTMAEMRGVKAEGGWGVVCTEECSVHPSSDLTPATLMRIWDDSDLPVHELMIEKVHAHGALAGIQLVHNGQSVSNYLSRTPSLSPSAVPTETSNSTQARAMDKEDIRELRRWFREAAIRSKRVGYDIVYVYAAHGIMTLLYQFLLRRFNKRTDEYGGSLENRVRLIREVLDDTKDAVGADCAVAFRFAVDELLGEAGMNPAEAEDVVGMLAELPDLWDVNVADWGNDSLPSRFGTEGAQEQFVRFVKQTTSKPVVGVGRFTSPDTMVSQIRRGVLDLIGAARPSIADPFLPKKIEEGRSDEIRECIGCNMCTSGDYVAYPMRCTQNPTMGEEWRKDWHPEKISRAVSDDTVLVVGAGPAGLEATLALSNRGYNVTLAEAGAEFGGRVLQETKLNPLSQWKRVADHRTYMLSTRSNVQMFTDSELDVDAILELGANHVAIATGAYWSKDFLGIHHRFALDSVDANTVASPEDVMNGKLDPDQTVMIFDDDHYYMGSALAEHLAEAGNDVILVTPASEVSGWTHYTLEFEHIQVRLRELGVSIICNKGIKSVGKDYAELECIYVGDTERVEIDRIVPVTARTSVDTLYQEMLVHEEAWHDCGVKTVSRIGDCLAPATIAMAVYGGHEFARELEMPERKDVLFRRENDFETQKIWREFHS